MKILLGIPLFIFLLIAYLILTPVADTATPEAVMTYNLFSGAEFKLTMNGLFLVIGTVFIFLEMIKSTRTAGVSVWDHVLSTFVFIGFIVAFLTMKSAGTQTFFILTLMSLVDVIAGFTITIASARRDFAMDRGPL